MKDNNFIFYSIVITLFFILTFPLLLTKSMFLDGIVYAGLAKNLAKGYYDIWHLNLSPTFLSKFYGHPPLQIWIEALIFKIFGNNIYIEKIYSFLTFYITGILLIKLWRLTTLPNHHKYGWIVLFYWIIIPLTSWAASNNLLENTMQIFILLAVIFIYKSFKFQYVKNSILAGFWLFAAIFTKGIVGFFPIVFPLIWLFIGNKSQKKKALLIFFILLFIIITSFLIVFYLFPDSRVYFYQYINQQIIGSLNLNTKENFNGRFFIIGILFNQIIPNILILTILFLYNKKNKNKVIINKKYICNIILFSILIIAGSLPFLISLKQRAFYLIPVLPFIALIFSYLSVPLIEQISAFKNNRKLLIYLNIFLIFNAILIMMVYTGKLGKDKEVLENVLKICEIIPENEVIAINENSIRKNYYFMAYLARYKRIGLKQVKNIQAHENEIKFFLTTKQNILKDTIFLPIDLNLKDYVLYINKHFIKDKN